MKRHALRNLILFVTIIVTAGCTSPGSDPAPEPTLEATATVAPTLTPGARSVGDLIEPANAAWATVSTMRVTFWVGSASEAATPPSTGQVTTEINVLPSARHVIHTIDGQVVDEQIALDGRVYMKGAIVAAGVAPMVGTNAWVEIDPAAATSNSPVAMQVAYLTSPIAPPFATISPQTLALEASPVGEISIGDRTCHAFTFGAPSGAGIQYELAIDANNLPCRLLQTSGGIANITTYEFNLPGLSITAPEIATPEAAP